MFILYTEEGLFTFIGSKRGESKEHDKWGRGEMQSNCIIDKMEA